MVAKGVPEHLRSDNGPEFVARDLRKWLAGTGAKTAYIEPGSPWENGYCESFNSKLRDESLNGEIFYSMKEIRVLAERWRIHYNTVRPHSSLGYRPPAPEAWVAKSLGYGEVETATRFPLPPHPRLQLSIKKVSRATLTMNLVQKIGQTSSSSKTRSRKEQEEHGPISLMVTVLWSTLARMALSIRFAGKCLRSLSRITHCCNRRGLSGILLCLRI
jgi:putative transposase